MNNEIYIGPAGWSYADWNGIVYPKTKPRSFDPLVFLASYFNLIEINSTFYRIPDPRTCEAWVDRVTAFPEFRFTVKAFHEYTHRKRRASPREIDVFKKALSPLFHSGRLNAVLVQFPWSYRFTAENLAYINELNRYLAPFPVAIEVRHGGWAAAQADGLFKNADMTLCAIDQPQLGDSLSPDTWHVGAAGGYARLHGRNYNNWFRAEADRDARYDYQYTTEELAEWTSRIGKIKSTATKMHVVLNNHFRGQAIANAFELKARLEGHPPRAPQTIISRFQHLKKIVRPDNRFAPLKKRNVQRSLFDDPEDE